MALGLGAIPDDSPVFVTRRHRVITHGRVSESLTAACDRLGHSSPAITMSHYAHADPDDVARTVSVIDRALRG